ncbi:MAG: HAMP domain-containing sensor histidine kinase [Peptococcaceae bacterium]|nr:HAMP domain-containing sensor histidine kinase [Peptococcaceae bacterium]
MIYRLRKKFIKICTLSFLGVFLLLFVGIFAFTSLQTRASLDDLADIVAANDGRFPDVPAAGAPGPTGAGSNPESPFTTRFFTVHFDAAGNVSRVDTRSIASVSGKEAASAAKEALARGKARGWYDNMRYKIYDTDGGQAVVFINASVESEMTSRFLLSAAAVFVGGSILVLALIVLFSRRAVRPVAESIARQKQFITDANHELKTPLAVMSTSIDILEDDIGKNDWLTDMREETARMNSLVCELITLSRMDEEAPTLASAVIDLSALLEEASAAQRGLALSTDITPGIEITGDAAAISRLARILLDNACKYADAPGQVHVALSGGKHPLLSVTNSCTAVATLPLARLFDRFYRADSARTDGGFGLGLSIAQAICSRHHAQITAQAPDAATIRFVVKF